MSSVSSINSHVNPYLSGVNSSPNSIKQDLSNLLSSLQAGDLNSAQSAFSSLQQAFTQRPASTTGNSGSSTSTNPVQKDLQAIQTALQSGDVKGAQIASTQLATDMKSIKGHHGHHHGAKPASANDDQSNSANNPTSLLLNAVQSSGPATSGSTVNQLT